jgi:hypothetical protein
LALAEASARSCEQLSFHEWVKHWGEAKLHEYIVQWRETYGGMWEHRFESLWQFPCWELIPGLYWTEDWQQTTKLWRQAGGRCFEKNRLIAAKWDEVWECISKIFPKGYGNPYPPYGRESCAAWCQIDSDEAIVLGVITEDELRDHIPPESDEQRREREIWWASLSDEDKALFREFADEQPTRDERYAEKKTREKISHAEMALAYQEQCRQRDERDAIFTRMEKMDAVFVSKDERPPDSELMKELTELMNSPVFDRYPKWRARAIRYAAQLLEESGLPGRALEFYETALAWDGTQPVKRKISKLRKLLGREPA